MPARPTLALLVAGAAALAGCMSLPASRPDPALYALDATFDGAPADGPGPALAVSPPRAAPGFDGPQMVYVRRPHELRYYAKSQWVDAPSRMLRPLLVDALERTGRFQSVADAPGASAGLRLDAEIVRLQQEFTETPSRVRFTLGVQVVDLESRKVIGSREIEAVEPAPSEDAYGGAVAANRAVRRALEEAAAFCATVAAGRPSASRAPAP